MRTAIPQSIPMHLQREGALRPARCPSLAGERQPLSTPLLLCNGNAITTAWLVPWHAGQWSSGTRPSFHHGAAPVCSSSARSFIEAAPHWSAHYGPALPNPVAVPPKDNAEGLGGSGSADGRGDKTQQAPAAPNGSKATALLPFACWWLDTPETGG